MIRYVLDRMLRSMQDHYDYDVSYMQEILRADLGGFLRFLGFQTMSSHRGRSVPAGPLAAARIRAIIEDDCGPCTQLVVDMALEAGVDAAVIRAIVARDFDAMPEDVALVARFAELVLAHDPQADPLREAIVERWGTAGLVAISFGISSTRVYPALKYAMGHGSACSRVRVCEETLAPGRERQVPLEVRHA